MIERRRSIVIRREPHVVYYRLTELLDEAQAPRAGAPSRGGLFGRFGGMASQVNLVRTREVPDQLLVVEGRSSGIHAVAEGHLRPFGSETDLEIRVRIEPEGIAGRLALSMANRMSGGLEGAIDRGLDEALAELRDDLEGRTPAGA